MERFKSPSAHGEVEKLVRANPMDVANTAEGLSFLVDENSRFHQKRDLKVSNIHATLNLLAYFLPSTFLSGSLSLLFLLSHFSRRNTTAIPIYFNTHIGCSNNTLLMQHFSSSHKSCKACVLTNLVSLYPNIYLTGVNLSQRLYRKIHLGNCKNFSAILPPDHLEHEG